MNTILNLTNLKFFNDNGQELHSEKDYAHIDNLNLYSYQIYDLALHEMMLHSLILACIYDRFIIFM